MYEDNYLFLGSRLNYLLLSRFTEREPETLKNLNDVKITTEEKKTKKLRLRRLL